MTPTAVVCRTLPAPNRPRAYSPGGCLSTNPDVDRVMTFATRPTAKETRDLIRALWRRYDLAISTQTGDRPTFLAFVANEQVGDLVQDLDAQPGLFGRLA